MCWFVLISFDVCSMGKMYKKKIKYDNQQISRKGLENNFVLSFHL